MPDVKYSIDDLNMSRIDIPLPFFMRDESFDVNQPKTGNDYHWISRKPLTLIVKNRIKTPKFFSSSNGIGDAMAAAILVGNPLECPFDLRENFEDPESIFVEGNTVFSKLDFCTDSYQPLDNDELRRMMRAVRGGDGCILKAFGLPLAMSDEDVVYFACNSNTADDLIMSGCLKEGFSELRVKGPLYAELSSFSLHYFLHIHTPIPQSQADKDFVKPVSKQVHAVYNIADGEYAVQGKVLLEFTWSEPDPAKLFDSPPPLSRSKVAICPKPGDATEELTKFWEEICLLEKLISLHKSNPNPDYHKTYYHHHPNNSTSGVVDESEVAHRIRELVQQPSTTSWSISKDPITSITIILQSILQADRADVDFTDRAWAILKNATGVSEIYEGIFEIFVNIERGYWRPYLLPTNKTSFGGILKDLRSEKLGNFRTILTPYLALEMAIEFGIMKLERDFSFLCTMCQLTDQTASTCVQNIKNYNSSLVNLQKLHCLVEIICLARNRFSLLPGDYQQFAQAVYRQLPIDGPLDWNKIFHFDYPNDQLIPFLTGIEPVYWNLRLETKGALRNLRTNVILSRDIFVPHAQKRILKEDGDHLEISPPWYQYVLRTSQRNQV